MLSSTAKVFLVSVVIVSATMVTFQIVQLVQSDDDVDRLYGALLLFTSLFSVYFGFEGVMFENLFQILGFLVFQVMMMFYVVYQVALKVNALTIVQMLVVMLGGGVFFLLSYKLYLIFGWQVYRKIGNDPAMRSLYRVHQMALTFVKIDFMFQVLLLAQNLVLILEPDDVEFWLNVGGVPVIVGVLTLVLLGLRYEHTGATVVFLVLAVIEPAYIVFRLYRLYDRSKYDDLPRPQMLASGIVSLIVRAIVVVVVSVVMSNYGRGLVEVTSGTTRVSGERKPLRVSFSNRRMTVVP